MVIFASFRGRSHLGALLVTVGAACTLSGLWNCPVWALERGFAGGRSAEARGGKWCSSASKLGSKPQVWCVYTGGRGREGNGTCQFFCSWRSSPGISVPLGHVLRLVNNSPSSMYQVLFKLLLLYRIFLELFFVLFNGGHSVSTHPPAFQS